MLINEDYFEDLKIKDEDIIDDDFNDVEDSKQELTIEELHKLPEQYNHLIRFRIEVDDDRDTTFIQTSLIPRLLKRLDTIFEMHDIKHSLYVLTSYYDMDKCNTVVKFGNYQLFCRKYYEKDKYINGTYDCFFINVYVNYPLFNYKRAFRFLYTMLNLYKNSKLINWTSFNLNTTNDYVIQLKFWIESKHIRFYYYNKKIDGYGAEINLSKELREEDKIDFYYSVFRHFFGDSVNVPYDAIERDVPIKPLRF